MVRFWLQADSMWENDSWFACAIEGGSRGRVGVEVFEKADEGRNGRGECAPRACDGGGAFDVVTAAGNTGETEADTGGKQVDGNRVRSFAVNDGRVTAIGSAGNDHHTIGAEGEAVRRGK